ncbi:hypothetical protein CR203_18310 [Salipaludibacillus neizhouensis]|uniref:Uncharacterized protein n=1 Tax=Salipaludibacillus neizhouensis TaxID=885475 RepID=A0A3A9KE88_9BACI|nr:hypothetical protein [Salipaludibacillus neizhouensis]RKL65815.1 hypothetical protein CR203_18310 [Salipaludibacillus neizhouensis]
MIEKLGTKEVVFEGKSLKMCDRMLEQKINPYQYHTGIKLTRQLIEQGIKTYGDLPHNLAELEKIDGVTLWKIGTMFQGMVTLNKNLRDQIYYDHGTLENEIVAFDHWLFTESHLEPSRLDPRYIILNKEKYLGFLEKRKITLKLLGELIGVTPERARQILRSGDRKLRKYTPKYFPRLTQAMMEPIEASIIGEPFMHYLLLRVFNHLK